MVRDWLAGVGFGAAVATAALRRFGRGEAGLRVATRATGQAALLPFLPYFTLRTGGRRDPWLQRYAGVHVVHVALIAVLLRRHGHPARGTAVYPVSVYGGSLGYVALVGLLTGGRPLSAAEWYLFLAVQGAPIPHAMTSKPALAPAVYPLLGGAWALGLLGRLGRRRGR